MGKEKAPWRHSSHGVLRGWETGHTENRLEGTDHRQNKDHSGSLHNNNNNNNNNNMVMIIIIIRRNSSGNERPERDISTRYSLR